MQSVKRMEYCPQVLAVDLWIDTVQTNHQHNSEAETVISMCPHLVGTLVVFVDKSLITNVGDDLHYVNKYCAKLHVGENSPTTR